MNTVNRRIWRIIPASTMLVFALASVVALTLNGCAGNQGVGGVFGDAGSVESAVPVITSPNDQRAYRALTLRNGLDVLLVSDPDAKKAAAAISIPVGAMWDPVEYQGMAHYVEHLIHLGSKSYPDAEEYSTFLAQNGGSRNAYTSLDETNYFFQINSDALEPMLDRFAGMFTGALLDPKYVEKEKNAVASEWSMRRESDSRAIYYISRSLLGDHPANRFATGNLETLADKAPTTLNDAARSFYQTYYSAHLMKGVLLGSDSLDELQAMAERYLAPIPNRSAVIPEITKELDFSQSAGKLVHYVPQDDDRSMQIEFLVDETRDLFRSSPGRYLSYILGSEMPNSPATVLKGVGWVSSFGVGYYADAYGNYGLMSINIPLTEAGMDHREEITDLVLSYLQKLREDGLDDRYVAELQTSLNNQFQFLEKIPDFSYVSRLASSMQKYPTENVINAPFIYERFDAASVQTVLSQLVPERMRVWYISKQEPANSSNPYYAGTYSVEPLVTGAQAFSSELADQAGLKLPALNSFLPESFALNHADPRPEKVVATANMELWVQGSGAFATQPKGLATIGLNSQTTSSPEKDVMFALWQDLYMLQNLALFEEAAVAGVSANLSADKGVSLSLSGFTDKQPQLVEAILDGLRVSFSDEAFAQAVDRYRRSLVNARRNYAYAQLFPALIQVLSSSEYPDELLAAALDEVTPAGLQAFIDRELATVYVRGFLYGNYSREDVLSWSRLIDRALPDRPEGQYVRSDLYQPGAGEILDYRADLPVEDLAMMLTYMAVDTAPKTEALNRILAPYLSEQMFNQLRTEEQLGYVVQVASHRLRQHSALMALIQTNVKAAPEMAERLERFMAESGQAVAAMDEATFDRWKASALANISKPPANLMEEAGPFLTDWEGERYQFDSRAQLISAVGSASLAEFKAHYRDVIIGDQSAKLMIQLRGRSFADRPFADVTGATVIDSTEAFHDTMPVQPRGNAVLN